MERRGGLEGAGCKPRQAEEGGGALGRKSGQSYKRGNFFPQERLPFLIIQIWIHNYMHNAFGRSYKRGRFFSHNLDLDARLIFA